MTRDFQILYKRTGVNVIVNAVDSGSRRVIEVGFITEIEFVDCLWMAATIVLGIGGLGHNF
jgi:hypothetical protein